MKIGTYKKIARSKKYIDIFNAKIVYKARHENPNEDSFLRERIFLRYINKENVYFDIIECKLLKIMGEEVQVETPNLKKII